VSRTKPEPPLLALLRCRSANTVALAVQGRLAWRSGPPVALTPPSPAPARLRLVKPQAPLVYAPDQWEVLSTDTEQITQVLQSTGIFDVLVQALGERMSNAPGGGAARKRVEWLIRSYDRQHGFEPD
jgi:hypothetical protein